MQGRSRMAALTLGAATPALLFTMVLTFLPGASARAEDKVVVKKVELKLMITGLGRDGCDVEIKPGNPGSRFEPVTRHVGAPGEADVIVKDVECRGADRDCAFAITIKETGHADKTVHRGLRVASATPDQPATVPRLTCYLSSPSKLARSEAERSRR